MEQEMNKVTMESADTEQPLQRPDNYLVWSILVTIFCFTLLGIPAIVFSALVNSKWNSKDYETAMQYSKNAKLFIWLAFGFGLASCIFAIIVSAFYIGVFSSYWFH